MTTLPVAVLGAALLAACGGKLAKAGSDAGTPGADGAAGDAPVDAIVVPLTPCPTSGSGAITPEPGSSCFAITPAETGASASGENATVASYALTAATSATPRGQLMLFFNGSGGHPAGPIPDPQVNFYNAATALGYDVLAVSYFSDASLIALCGTTDSCFLPTRETMLLGVTRPGAASGVQGITLDEGAADRVVLALRALAQRDPGQRWASYLVNTGSGAAPETEIAWNKLVVAGHSQGGGHAAVLGKLFPVARVIQLSATCDGAGTTPASWTDGTTGTWASDPTQFYGFGAATIFRLGQPSGGDTVCSRHLVNWQHLGMIAANQRDNAATCGATTAGGFHSASIMCVQNQSAWTALLQ